jgi:hypothetical protein
MSLEKIIGRFVPQAKENLPLGVVDEEGPFKGANTIPDTVARVAAEKDLFIITKALGEHALIHQNIREAYKKKYKGKYSSLSIPLDYEGDINKKDKKGMFADNTRWSNNTFFQRDFIWLHNADNSILIGGDFIGTKPKDVITAIEHDPIPVIIFKGDKNDKLANKIKRFYKGLRQTGKVSIVSTEEGFEEAVSLYYKREK